MSKILDNHELAMRAAGALIVSFEKRGDIEGTFDPVQMCKPIEDAISAAVAAEHQRMKEQCAKVAVDSLLPELSSPATRLVVEQAAHAILALP